jgi:hypothetical protein
MALKVNPVFPAREKAAQRAAAASSWAVVGIDTSMTAISAVTFAYDAITDKRKGPFFAEIRWSPEIDYFTRLRQALKVDRLVSELLAKTWVRSHDNVHVAIEEPWYFGAVKTGQSGWLKQQAEIAGVVKASLFNYGFVNITEINNSQWHATLRKDGVVFPSAPRGSTAKEKAEAKLANKFAVKDWATLAFGLPSLPDLVASKSGAKIPRPESGPGSTAKAVQPSDVYDAAACCAWMIDTIEEMTI